jgi:hypothetical protein
LRQILIPSPGLTVRWKQHRALGKDTDEDARHKKIAFKPGETLVMCKPFCRHFLAQPSKHTGKPGDTGFSENRNSEN